MGRRLDRGGLRVGWSAVVHGGRHLDRGGLRVGCAASKQSGRHLVRDGLRLGRAVVGHGGRQLSRAKLLSQGGEGGAKAASLSIVSFHTLTALLAPLTFTSCAHSYTPSIGGQCRGGGWSQSWEGAKLNLSNLLAGVVQGGSAAAQHVGDSTGAGSTDRGPNDCCYFWDHAGVKGCWVEGRGCCSQAPGL